MKTHDLGWDKPIILVGAARSGTTMLGNLLAGDPIVGYTGEINFVWRYGSAFRKGDYRFSASRKEKDYIRSWFRDFHRRSGAKVIIDKTPQNCLRLPFIIDVFPDAKIIHLVRDGRAVAFSAAREWCGIGRSSLDSPWFRSADRGRQVTDVWRRKSRLGERVTDLLSLMELVADIPRAYTTMVRILRPGRPQLWGPRVYGLNEMRRKLSILEVCAWQWDACCRGAESAGLEMDFESYLRVRYEDLLARPEETTDQIWSFVGVGKTGSRDNDKRKIVEKHAQQWRKEGTEEEIRHLTNLLAPTLGYFGYPTGEVGHGIGGG